MSYQKPLSPTLALWVSTLCFSMGLYFVTESTYINSSPRAVWATHVSEGSVLYSSGPATSNTSNASHDPYKDMVKSEAAQGLLNYIQERYNVKKITAENIVAAVFRHSNDHQIEPALVLGIIDRESGFQMDAASPVGAVGLMQVWPKWHQDKIKEAEGSNSKLWEIDFNIQIGTKILREYLDQSNGRLTEALARYNGSLGKNNGYPSRVLKSRDSYQPYIKPLLPS